MDRRGISRTDRQRTGHLRYNAPVAAGYYPCAAFDTIAQLEPTESADTHECNYSLGERIFLDLRQSLGPGPFQERLARLYRTSIAEDRTPISGTKMTITQIRDIFGDTTAG